jgi:uncharacterized delta-60 repeat protein
MKKVLVILGVCSFVLSIKSSDGVLDTTFNSVGYAIAPSVFFVSGTAIQDDGKIILVGTTPNTVFEAIRYNTDGTIDTLFGESGLALGPQGIPFDGLIQADGNIVLAGQDNSGNFQLVRYDSSGNIDNSFGSGGVAVGPTGFCARLGLQTDGKIVAAGGDNSGNVYIVRYNMDGSIDITFDTGPLGYAEDIKIQEDGKTITAGTNNFGFFQLIRYNSDGSFDASFGTSGVATGPQGTATSIVLQSDGKLIAAGCDASSPNNVQLVRFNTDGTTDNTFGTSSVVVGPQGIVNDMVLQSDGKILVISTNNNQMQLIRYTASGTLDVTFGISGIASLLDGLFYGVGLQSNGDIIVVGLDTTFSQSLVARLTNSQSLTDTFISGPLTSGTGTITFSGTAQNPSNVYFYLDGDFVGGTVTDILGTNTWSFPINVSVAGTYVLRAVSLYKDGNVNNSCTQGIRIF